MKCKNCGKETPYTWDFECKECWDFTINEIQEYFEQADEHEKGDEEDE